VVHGRAGVIQELIQISQARIAATETRQRELEEAVREKDAELTKITTDFQYNLKLLEDRDAELERMDAQLSQSNQTLGKREAELQAARDLLAKFESEFNAQHSRIQQLEANTHTTSTQHTNARAEAEAAEVQLAELAAANDALRSQLSEARGQVESLSTHRLDSVQLSATNNALQARVAELEEAAALAAAAAATVPDKVASVNGSGSGYAADMSGPGDTAAAAAAAAATTGGGVDPTAALTEEMRVHREQVAEHQRALDESTSKLAAMEAALADMAVVRVWRVSRVSLSGEGGVCVSRERAKATLEELAFEHVPPTNLTPTLALARCLFLFTYSSWFTCAEVPRLTRSVVTPPTKLGPALLREKGRSNEPGSGYRIARRWSPATATATHLNPGWHARRLRWRRWRQSTPYSSERRRRRRRRQRSGCLWRWRCNAGASRRRRWRSATLRRLARRRCGWRRG